MELELHPGRTALSILFSNLWEVKNQANDLWTMPEAALSSKQLFTEITGKEKIEVIL